MIADFSEALGQSAASIMKGISLSNDTVERRISDMADDTERQIIEKIKKSELFALQLDETTHIQNNSILLTYVRYTRDRLCGLVVGVSDYRYRGLGFYSRRYQIF